MKRFLLSLGLAICMILPGKAQFIVVNFDSLDTSGGEVSGTTLDNYLANYGIVLGGVTPGTTVEVIASPGAAFPAPSGTNMITQEGSAESESYTLTFAQPISDVSFVRGEYNGSNPPSSDSGIIYPEWSVNAYSGVTDLGFVGENLRGTNSDVAAQTFTLNYGGITSLTFEGNAEGVAGLGSPLIDNLEFLAPEPSTWAMLVGGLVMLGLWRRRISRARA